MTISNDIDYEELSENEPMYMHLAAGAAAGIMEHTIVYPFDSIKTRMQIVSKGQSMVIYDGVINSIKLISTTEGFKALWRGVASVCIGAGPAHALYFASYEKAKTMLGGSDDSKMKPIAAGLAGGIGTIVSDFVMNPFDVVKQRMQAYGQKYKTVFKCGVSILQKEGIRAFYVSYPTTLLMTLPFQTIHFGLYDVFKKSMNPDNKYSPFTHVTAGALSGGVAAAITNPVDCAKTLLQTRGASHDSSIKNVSGIIKPIKIIVSTYGVKGLFRGVIPRVVYVMPGTGISWLTYEYFKRFLSKNN